MSAWWTIVSEQGLAAYVETSVHPHAPEERADLFRCAGGATTEFEYLNLLHALVLAAKPSNVLETGCFKGMGTLALASALAANGFGTVHSIDLKPPDELTTNLERYGLADRVRIVASDSVSFCATYAGDPFDFAFFDANIHGRAREHDLLRRRGKVAPGALCVFHDASPIRHQVMTSFDYIKYTEALPGIMLPLSRGLKLSQEPAKG
jgi:predicted O-methyltransferase YrrM